MGRCSTVPQRLHLVSERRRAFIQFPESSFTRGLEHETGHIIGLGHTQDSVAIDDNIMYPFCCGPLTSIAPAIGADVFAGLSFIYPASGCSYALSSDSTQVPALATSFT